MSAPRNWPPDAIVEFIIRRDAEPASISKYFRGLRDCFDFQPPQSPNERFSRYFALQSIHWELIALISSATEQPEPITENCSAAADVNSNVQKMLATKFTNR